MRKAARVILAVAGLAVVVGAIVPWAESEKELAVLCRSFRPGAARRVPT
jgi:hypothetical protein